MVLMVVDVQKGITDERLYNFPVFIDNVKKLINAARSNHVEVIYVQHDDGPGTGFSIGDEEFEIYEEIRPMGQEKVYYKTTNSCFGNADLTAYLQNMGAKTLFIIGLQTNFCIDATVKSAFERGYEVVVPLGANSTFDNEYMDGETTYKYYNEMMWPQRFAACLSVDETIERINKQS